MGIEEEFDMNIPDDDLDLLGTDGDIIIGDVCDYITKKLYSCE